ncbi:MAG TPA: biosynthetic arginine decarboxylase, partial [Myxococcaceae bacterium]|nr:biosynthetic arginine decarboxylase [Myxococcaceae bacterium]
MAAPTPQQRWTIADSLETYGIRSWGVGYFGINDKGNVCVHPDGPGAAAFDLKDLVDEVRRRGIGLPLLIRFTDVLRHRVIHLNEAFRKAIAEHGYKGSYRGVYPIKVNQHRHVVETIVDAGKRYGYGLEAGSKPELLAVMALLDDDDSLVICNGYKDEEYIETALLASRLGRKVVLVVEKPSELPLIAEISRRTGIRPTLGMRVRLSTRGAGKWEASGGDRSKFGLSSSELMEAIGFLREAGMLDCFELLHFHLGSQIANIRSVKNALREAVRFYVEVSKQGAPLGFLDVGGGLGVDYDGSRSVTAASVNYSIQEYANDVVYSLAEACRENEVPMPHVISESGRALTAHHALLLVNVIDLETQIVEDRDEIPEEMHTVVHDLAETLHGMDERSLREVYHDATYWKDLTRSL